MAAGRKTGGRVKGSTNRLTKDIKVLAQGYGPAAIRRLALFAGLAKPTKADLPIPPQAQGQAATALKELLDRGYGKARQPLEHDLSSTFEDFLREIGKAIPR